MSRVGKKLITLPSGVTATLDSGVLTVKGPQGELKRAFKESIAININGSEITLLPMAKSERGLSAAKPLWGTYSSHVQNMIKGAAEGFTKELIVEGIGFKAAVVGESLNLELGFSHPIKMPIPAGVKVTVERGNMTMKGSDIEVLGQFAASVRALKPTEPYKGKGIRYVGEHILRKQGKKTAA